ncbi:MAG: ATP-binding protein [Longimicrobiaceae bacterium]
MSCLMLPPDSKGPQPEQSSPALDLSAFVLEHVADAFILLDRDFRVTSMNAAAERINGGARRAEVIGRTHWEEWPASVGTRVETEYRRAMAERIAVHFEWHYCEPPDHDVWLEIDAYPAGDGLAVFYRDITPRKVAEAETRDLVSLLQAERAQLAAIVHQIPAGVIVAEAPSGKILVANERVAEIWQRGSHTAESVDAYDTYRGFHPDGTPYAPGDWPLARAITSGEVIRNQRIEILRLNGTKGTILVSAAPIRDARGVITAGVVIFEDISEQAGLEADRAALGENLAKQLGDWQTLFSLTPVGLAVAEDPLCETIRVNDAFARLLEVSSDSNVSSGGPNASELPYVALRGDRELAVDELPLQAAAGAAEPRLGEEVDIVFRDGHRVTLRADAVPLFDTDGSVRGALGAFTDITDQRRRERANRLLADVSATLADSLDFDDTLRTIAGLAVPSLADWCIVDLCEEGGMRRVAVVHKDPAMRETADKIAGYAPSPGSENRVIKVCETGEPILVSRVEQGFVERVAADEHHARAAFDLGIASFVIAPLKARGETYGAITAVRGPQSPAYESEDLELLMDISGRAALAIANAKLYREAQRLSKAKSDFLAVMSHELRTPLNAILGFTALLREEISGPINAAQESQLARVRSAATHLLALIDEILTLARIEAGKQQLDMERIEVGDTLRDIAALAEPSALAKGLRLDLALPSAPCEMTTDVTKLRQIVLNLLSNAVKFTSEGAVSLGFKCWGGEVEIEVRDTGKGIPPEHLDLVFEPFFQEDQRNVGQTSGTGLGLAVSRELARLMGGDLTARSALGVGTTFTLRVPVHSSAAGETAD